MITYLSINFYNISKEKRVFYQTGKISGFTSRKSEFTLQHCLVPNCYKHFLLIFAKTLIRITQASETVRFSNLSASYEYRSILTI